jgi:hypothetical protein
MFYDAISLPPSCGGDVFGVGRRSSPPTPGSASSKAAAWCLLSSDVEPSVVAIPRTSALGLLGRVLTESFPAHYQWHQPTARRGWPGVLPGHPLLAGYILGVGRCLSLSTPRRVSSEAADSYLIDSDAEQSLLAIPRTVTMRLLGTFSLTIASPLPMPPASREKRVARCLFLPTPGNASSKAADSCRINSDVERSLLTNPRTVSHAPAWPVLTYRC